MKRIRAPLVTALLLALVLAAGSVTMAVVRGQTRIGGPVLICTGPGGAVPKMDANGQPAGPRPRARAPPVSA